MKTIKLTGRLGKEFGKEFRLDVDSPAEAIRALCYQVPGFENALKEGSYRVTRISKVAKYDMDVNSIPLGFGKATGMIIQPVVAGGKKNGLGKIILGIALIGAAFFFAPAAGLGASLGAEGTLLGASGLTYGYLAQVGAMMALSGISQMLTPTPKAPGQTEQRESFLIDATGNLYEQGNPVPIVFGELYVGSVVISAGVTAEELP